MKRSSERASSCRNHHRPKCKQACWRACRVRQRSNREGTPRPLRSLVDNFGRLFSNLREDTEEALRPTAARGLSLRTLNATAPHGKLWLLRLATAVSVCRRVFACLVPQLALNVMSLPIIIIIIVSGKKEPNENRKMK